MDLTPSERARTVVRYLAKKQGITMAQVGRQIGYTNKSSFSAVLGGQKTIPSKFGEKLAALDPAINLAFLDGTSDQMLLPGYEQPYIPELPARHQPAASPVPPGSIVIPPELVKMFTAMSDTIKSQQEMIRGLVEGKGEQGGGVKAM